MNFWQKYCKKLEPSGHFLILELDEMQHYIQKNKESRSGKSWIVLQGNYLNEKLMMESSKL